ncbi:hypothetical protein ACOSQ2_015836 [Xanthoceras sorbifolium]
MYGYQNKPKPCAACNHRKTRCGQDCILAPYFPPGSSTEYNNAHKLFGRERLEKWINELEPCHRDLAMHNIKYEANARASYPSGGCVRVMWDLQAQIWNEKLKLNHMRELVAFYRTRARLMSTTNVNNVHDHQGFESVNLDALSNFQDFNNVPPPNLVSNEGQVVHSFDLYNAVQNQFPASSSSSLVYDQNQNEYNIGGYDARFSSVEAFQQNQPNRFFSLAEPVNDNVGERNTPLLNQTPNLFDVSSSQLIQNQPIVQLYESSEKDHEYNNLGDFYNNLGDFYKLPYEYDMDTPLLNQNPNFFDASSSQLIQNQPIVQLYESSEKDHDNENEYSSFGDFYKSPYEYDVDTPLLNQNPNFFDASSSQLI